MPEVTEAPERERFEIHVDGELAGYLEYRRAEGLRIFSHTEIDEAHGGQGLGSELIRASLAAMREQDMKVLPLCPFVKAYLQRHPEDLDVVRDADRQAFGLDA